MHVLVYGFGPYKQFRENITDRVTRRLPRPANLRKIVFPVRFHKSQFTEAVRKYRPDFVLGLGQCSKGRLLRIERRAVNKRRNDKQERARSIVRGGPKWLTTSLKLEKLPLGKQIRISYDPGDYVCNFSMYVLLDYLRRHRRKVRFGFIHIPHRYNTRVAVHFLSRILEEEVDG